MRLPLLAIAAAISVVACSAGLFAASRPVPIAAAPISATAFPPAFASFPKPLSTFSPDTTIIDPALLRGQWPSAWISCPGITQRGYGIYHFRKTFVLPSRPDRFVIHTTADNRYRLFVNGHPICSGPARGDLYSWYFETIDIAPWLQAGSNTIAALVWNMGEWAPVAQVSNQTGFVLQGDGTTAQLINSDRSWKVFRDTAYRPCSLDNGQRLRSYMVIGPGDQVKAKSYPWGWEQNAYDDSRWQQAAIISHPVATGHGTDNLWTLVPRNIPLMEEIRQAIPIVRRSKGIGIGSQFLAGGRSIVIPARATVSILLDQGYNTVAYPELIVSGGNRSVVRMTYAEALFDPKGDKGDRNVTDGKDIIGNYDIFEPDGGKKRLFRPLWFRTYRYLQLDITTGDQPLVIDDLHGMKTGYPFKRLATFQSNDSSLQQLWEVGWRTARLCAGETYFDCPYYEQLQYEGDTRIQSLISLYMTGDDRLMKKALLDFFHSRVPEGLTQGRYPSNRLQVIPPFSLFWVSMIYDYWMHRGDPAFIRPFLPAIEAVLYWYENNIDGARQMLGPMPWWNFVDWNTQFPGGTPDGATNGNSSVLTLQYAYTLDQAADLFGGLGRPETATRYRELAASLKTATYRLCYDEHKDEMANTPDKTTFSQHAGIMGVLSGAIPGDKTHTALLHILHDSTMSQATFYYRFYLMRALKKTGMADLYYGELKPWRDMLKIGLTTFAENPEPTRSDCHAWSASPCYDFLCTICGIMPDAPGFARVLIQPAPGELKDFSGSMPHPAGMISVSLHKKENGGIEGDIQLPPALSGRFVWRGKEVALQGGTQHISL